MITTCIIILSLILVGFICFAMKELYDQEYEIDLLKHRVELFQERFAVIEDKIVDPKQNLQRLQSALDQLTKK